MAFGFDDAVFVNDQVREFFAAGAKSSNKVYIDTTKKSGVKIKERYITKDLDRVRDAATNLDGFRDSIDDARITQISRGRSFTIYDAGQFISKATMNIAGNCDEMALLAIYKVVAAYQQKYVYKVSLSFDHVFCYVGLLPLSSVKVSGFKDMGDAGFAIDPWLNVVCPIKHYEFMASAKLEKWTAEGKRISWRNTRTKKWGAYVPNGEYKQAMIRSDAKFRGHWERY